MTTKRNHAADVQAMAKLAGTEKFGTCSESAHAQKPEPFSQLNSDQRAPSDQQWRPDRLGKL